MNRDKSICLNTAASLVSTLALAVLIPACQPASKTAAPPPAPVTARQPIQREVTEWDEYPARIDAVDMVEVRARESGYLESVHFKEGTVVKQGALLFVIDPRPYQAELERQEAALNQAQTRLELAQNDLNRAQRLEKSRAIS